MGLTSKKITIIALAATGEGISGGDRIFIEFARHWSEKLGVKIITSKSGKRMCKALNLPPRVIVHEINFGFVEYLSKILFSIYLGCKLKLEKNDIVYSASEFWMDSIPCFILKLRYPKFRWVAAWYQTAPKPFKGFTEGNRSNTSKFRALLYWIAQLPVKPLIDRYADFIIVNNKIEKRQFKNLSKKRRVLIIYGGVDFDEIKNYREKYKNLHRIYDAVFQGRFHPQKGVMELIEIWKKVVEKTPKAKLAMIGDGPLMRNVKLKIKNEKLEKNIKLFGYIFDGSSKYKIFSQSKIVVHPSFYDSGGMAAAEAMVFGLPCVGFDLQAYKSYYPKGMVKITIGDLEAFAISIYKLIIDTKYRQKLGRKSLQMIDSTWAWSSRSNAILKVILK